MAVVLGVLVAAAFGSGDFLGGRASRECSALVVLFVAQCTAVVGAVAVALLIGADVTGRDIAYGAGAGLLNAAGLGLLYRGLATGRMGVVAPVTAVVAAVIPIAWGVASGERPSVVIWVGVVVAVAAGGVVAREPDLPDEAPTVGARDALLLAVGAGALLGTSFIGFAETADESGYWPVLAARVAAVVAVGLAFVVVASRHRRVAAITRPATRLAAAAGALDVAATALLLTAVRRGLVVVVAPLAALAPAFTVVWAWLALHEPISRHQLVGLVLSFAGLVLIAAG